MTSTTTTTFICNGCEARVPGETYIAAPLGWRVLTWSGGYIGDEKREAHFCETCCEKYLRALDTLLEPQADDREEAPPETDAPTATYPTTVCFTGSMERMTHGEHRVKAEAAGYQVLNTVSKRTTLVVAGPGAGSKLSAARQLGISVVDEDAWLARIRTERGAHV